MFRTRVPFFTTLVAGLALTVACGAKDAPLDEPADGASYTAPEGVEEEAKAERKESPEPAVVVTAGESTPDTTTIVRGTKSAEKDAARSQMVMPQAEPAPSMDVGDDDGSYDIMEMAAASAPSRTITRAPKSAPHKAKKRADSGVGGISGGGSIGYADGLASVPRTTPPPPPIAFVPPAEPARTEVPAHLQNNSEEYTDYGINDFTITSKDGLSTFAIDVDTAAYSITRSKLNNGYLPSTSAVRVEEFVNYFDYEYKRPSKSDPFTVDFEASPAPWNPENHLVRVGVQGKRVSFDERKPVHLTFLVDVSGSMQAANKMGLVKKTLKMLTEELADGDTVAIVAYAGRTEIVLEPTPMSQKSTIIRSLDRLSAGGSTAMGAGIDLAYRLADATFKEGQVNRVIVCSDGDANVGQTSHEAMTAKIRKYADKGVTLTTVGYGNGNYKDTRMERLANDGDGNYYYIDTEAEARRVFVDKLTGAMEVIAKDVKIQVDWNPEDVVAYRLIGYENRDVADRDFRNDAVDAGEIGAGHQVTALYEVALADDAAGDIATVRIRNKAPGADSPAVERSFTLNTRHVKSQFNEASDQFRIAASASAFAEILRGSPHVSEISLRQVQGWAKAAARPEYPADAELVALIGTAARLKGEGVYSSR